MSLRLASLLAVLAALLPAQRGDAPGEVQPPLPAGLVVPPAPVLTADAALRTFALPDGLRIELVASEPLVNDPVAMTFAADGRLWVVEMRGFMPNVDGEGELEPNGRVVVLRDNDGDGRMDESSVFLDGLVLPRGVALCGDGVLVIEPPDLWLWRDTDGDGRGDRKERVADGFEEGLLNVEHAGNSPLWGLDNWLYLAKYPWRLRRMSDGWQRQPALGGGQWGLSQDDRGRLHFNYNSDWLRADAYPSHYALRNPHLGRAAGVNVQLGHDQRVWPSRITPGVNRGYRQGQLREFKLATFTAVCAPLVYRGDALPDCRGDVFVCEPSANLVRRGVFETADGRWSARNAYDEREFLTSTDERFRPVNLHDGPDGALYVVDMYRGIVQHRNFVTSWLRKQILDRGLDKPLGLGRIYRIVPQSWRRTPVPDLASATSGALVAELGHANGWRRDTAQRLLVERRDRSVAGDLLALANGAGPWPARLHALWTLEGIGALDRYALLPLLDDDEPRVRAAVVRLAEPLLRAGDPVLMGRLSARLDEPDRDVRLQMVATLGEADHPSATILLAGLAERNHGDGELRSLLLSGLRDRELEFLETHIAPSPAVIARDPGALALVQELARCVVRARDPARSERLLASPMAGVAASRLAVLEGTLAALPKGDARKGSLPLPPASMALDALARATDPQVRALGEQLAAAASEAATASKPPRDEQEFLARGQRGYAAVCAACHLSSGEGMGGQAPALKDSAWVLGPPERLLRILLHGVTGPIDVDGERFDGTMSGWGMHSDDNLAAIASYVRRAWGNAGTLITTADVRAVRDACRERSAPWTAAELMEIR